MKRSPMKRKSARRIAKETPEEKAWKAWIHFRPCYLMHCAGCGGEIQQAHERKATGLSLKAPNRRSIPLCRKHHQEFDQHRGHFSGWTRESRQGFMDVAIEMTNAAFERAEDVNDSCPF